MKIFLSALMSVVCSFYAESFRGKRTANGEIYSPEAMTAASNNHKFGTKLRVTASGRSVEVVVNDRTAKRFADRLDLSPAAFKQLAPLDVGLIDANVSVIK